MSGLWVSASVVIVVISHETCLIAFIAIGHTATAVGSEMKPFLEPVMNHIKHGLQMRG